MKKTITTIIIAMFLTLSIYSQTWTPLTSGATNWLYGISFTNNTTGISVGIGGVILKTTNGTSWAPLTSGTTVDLFQCQYTSLDTIYVAGNAGTILKSVNGGTNWAALNSGITTDLRNLYFVDNNIGFVCGGPGVILKTTNAGATWTPQSTGTSQVIYAVYFYDSNNGCAVGYNGTVLYTSNGGSTWTPGNSGTTNTLYSVFFTSATNGYAVGDGSTALKTTNGGSTWTPFTTGTSGQTLTSIKFLSSTVGYICGGNASVDTSTVIKTIDGGATWGWEATNTTRLSKICFPSLNVGYACGYTNIIKYTVSCTNPPATITPQSGTTFCQGGFVTLNANTGTGYTYQWYVNSTLLSGFTNSSYTATQSGNYTVVISNGACSTTSSATTVTVNPNPVVTLGSIGSLINNNAATITLTGSPAGGTYSGAVSTSSFNPHAVGLGTKVINYSYTTGAGCSSNTSISTIVYDTTGNVCTTYDTITTFISVTDTLIIHPVLTGASPPNNTTTIKVYPNPTSDHIYIDNGNYSLMSGYKCIITNTLSQQVFFSLINQQQFYIDITTWGGNGLYFLTIKDAANNTIEIKKIVIQ